MFLKKTQKKTEPVCQSTKGKIQSSLTIIVESRTGFRTAHPYIPLQCFTSALHGSIIVGITGNILILTCWSATSRLWPSARWLWFPMFFSGSTSSNFQIIDVTLYLNYIVSIMFPSGRVTNWTYSSGRACRVSILNSTLGSYKECAVSIACQTFHKTAFYFLNSDKNKLDLM